MTRWGIYGLSLYVAIACAGLTSNLHANISKFEVIPAYAPQGTISPSWSGYVTNAVQGIDTGMDVGDRSTSAAAYERIQSPIPPTEMIYTPFNSWRAVASPNPAFQPPFTNEFGNRVHFGLHIVADQGWEFKLDDLKWAMDSNDVTDYFDQQGNFQGQNYSSARVGINYGADGAPGGGDDIVYDSGEPGTNPINELIYVGVGDGFVSDNPSALNDQADIDLTLANIFSGCDGCTVDLKATYTLPDPHTGGEVSGMGTVVIVIPEPSTMAMILMGSLGLIGLVRRRR